MKNHTPKFNSLLEKYSFLIKEQPEQPVTQPTPEPQPVAQDATAGQLDAPEQAAQDTDQSQDQQQVNKASEGYAYLTNIIYNLLTLSPESLPKDLMTLSELKITDSKKAFQLLNKLVEVLPADLRIQILKANFGGSGQLQVTDQDMSEMANVALRALFYKDKVSNEFTGLKDDVQSEIDNTGGKVTTDNAKSIYTKIKNLVGVEIDTQE